MQPIPYLFFNGDCREAMTRYAEILGGTVFGIVTNAEAPDVESRMPGGDDLVMNMALQIGAGTIMASDAPVSHYRAPQGFFIQLEAASPDEFDRWFAGLSEGARSVDMPPGETFWAERFTMFTDRHGTPWMLNYSGGKEPQP